MKQTKLQAFLDDYNVMTIIVDQKYYHHEYQLSVYENKQPISFSKRKEVLYDQVYKVTLKIAKDVNLRDDWKVTLDESLEAEVLSGKVVRTKRFISEYDYQPDDLGFQYQPDVTLFKLWAPIAKKVHLLLESPNGEKETIELDYDQSGVWVCVYQKDLENYAYHYNVYVNGGWKKVKDPYAIASQANGDAAYVINDAKTYNMTHDNQFSNSPIVYEVSVRDFTSNQDVAFKHSKKYLGMIEENRTSKDGHPIGFDYVKDIGVTHIQMMPVYDFTGINERNPDQKYNWGYNPSQYFVPEGSYSSDPDDAYCRINELKQVIDVYHEHGLGVIMDVVYNHVDAYKKFPYEILVPGYSFRVDKQEIMTDFSGCGNDLNTSQPMIRKLIIDSLKRWTAFYKMDGFRFDLMGLIDVETMNQVVNELKKINPNVLLYGEGWRMDDSDTLAHMYNQSVSKTIGFFNDHFRDSVKGSTFNLLDKGFAFGNMDYQTQVDELYSRQSEIDVSQSINYVECHDNHTFFDKAMTITEDEHSSRNYQLLATCLTILAPGTPFLHLGQLIYRSKQCFGNSYNLSDDINQIIWYDVDRYWRDIEIVKKLIQFKKEINQFDITDIEWFDEGFNFSVNGYQIFVLVKESEIETPDEDLLVLSTTKNHQLLKDIGIYIYERKSSHVNG